MMSVAVMMMTMPAMMITMVTGRIQKAPRRAWPTTVRVVVDNFHGPGLDVGDLAPYVQTTRVVLKGQGQIDPRRRLVIVGGRRRRYTTLLDTLGLGRHPRTATAASSPNAAAATATAPTSTAGLALAIGRVRCALGIRRGGAGLAPLIAEAWFGPRDDVLSLPLIRVATQQDARSEQDRGGRRWMLLLRCCGRRRSRIGTAGLDTCLVSRLICVPLLTGVVPMVMMLMLPVRMMTDLRPHEESRFAEMRVQPLESRRWLRRCASCCCCCCRVLLLCPCRCRALRITSTPTSTCRAVRRASHG